MLIFRFCFVKMEESNSYEVKKKRYTLFFCSYSNSFKHLMAEMICTFLNTLLSHNKNPHKNSWAKMYQQLSIDAQIFQKIYLQSFL